MASKPNLFHSLVLFIILVAFFLLGMIYQQRKIVREEKELASVKERLKTMSMLEPDVGDSMRELQPAMAKLWYANKYKNYPLALYEVKEIKEIVETVEVLKPVVNSVDVAMVLSNMVNTPVADMETALRRHDDKKFIKSYAQTISTCNACHQMTGFGFNRIIVPTAPPVVNQDWRPATSAIRAKSKTK